MFVLLHYIHFYLLDLFIFVRHILTARGAVQVIRTDRRAKAIGRNECVWQKTEITAKIIFNTIGCTHIKVFEVFSLVLFA